ncbi:glycosyltransferase [Metabacillus litoralis]|uniref:glycosyltransferase n=1 Tax=Metabacillus TaxID=2675233 RepID=UPI001B9C9F79|nr:glycosyltransferase [Metabacillus litoralis]UHA57890.1 glycosyltransferase [Metabacillus litoralis]
MKKKVLFVNGHLNIGGAEKSLIDILKHIDYNLYEVDVFLIEGLGDYWSEVPKEVNLKYYDLTKSYGSFVRIMVKSIKTKDWFTLFFRIILLLKYIFGDQAISLAKPLFKLYTRYDCAIAYRPGICTEIVGYLVKSNKKVTWWHHGSYDYSNKLTKSWSKVYKRFDKIVAVSDSSRKLLINNIIGIDHKVITIPNIINVEDILYKAKNGTPYIHRENFITLASVGRLTHEKGMVNCVHACKKLVEKGYNVKWYIIGEGDQRAKIKRYINEYKLAENIEILGALPNPYPYMKNVDIFVHPSLVESLSITVLEALALNTPVTVVKSLGPMEFIRHEENGILVDPTPDGLYEGIVSLLKDDTLYKRLKKDKTEVLINYSPEVVMDKIYNLIEVC